MVDVDLSDLERIRANVAHWDAMALDGTYKADEIDYGQVNVAILRDFRVLLHHLNGRERRIANLERMLDRAARPVGESTNGMGVCGQGGGHSLGSDANCSSCRAATARPVGEPTNE